MNDTDLRNKMARLPKWAQNLIANQDRLLAERDRHIAELSAGPEDSDVYVHDYVHPDRLLGKGVPVSFRIANGIITVKHSKQTPGALEIRSTSNRAFQPLYITPQVSNVFQVRLGDPDA